jgi:Uma2 family endonuclease
MMPIAQEKEKNRYTYTDYLEFEEGDGKHYEIVDGDVYMMAAPLRLHQGICMILSAKLFNFLEGKPCEVYSAPFTVRLFPQKDMSDDTVVEPDITVVCDPSKLDDRGCNGAPDLIIEVLSPSEPQRDLLVKYRKYQKAGVREYWIVDPGIDDPLEQTIRVCLLRDGNYVTSEHQKDEIISVTVLPGCEIDLKEVFR